MDEFEAMQDRVNKLEGACALYSSILSGMCARQDTFQAALTGLLKVCGPDETIRAAVEQEFERTYADALATNINQTYQAELERFMAELRQHMSDHKPEDRVAH